MTKKQKKMLTRIIICAVMLVALQFLPITGIPRFILYLAAYLVIGYDILKKAGKGILNGRVFDENFLMTVATIGALPAHTVAICGYLEPISAVVFSRVILREVISPVQMVGILLILGGAIFGERASGAEGC